MEAPPIMGCTSDDARRKWQKERNVNATLILLKTPITKIKPIAQSGNPKAQMTNKREKQKEDRR